MLKDSWATTFRNEVYANIDEEPYRKLFDEEGTASRPNSPINTIVAAAILKKMFALSEDDLFESINLDLRYSHELNLYSLSEDVFSLRIYERLISKVAEHHEKTGEDLIQQTYDRLTEKIAKVMSIDKTNRRMDSFMVKISAKDMTRRELIYKAIKVFVSYLFLIGNTEGISHMEHYTHDGDQNNVLYRCPPLYSKNDEKTGQCHATFDAACCDRCPYSPMCKPKGKGNTRNVSISQKKVQRAKRQAKLSGEESIPTGTNSSILNILSELAHAEGLPLSRPNPNWGFRCTFPFLDPSSRLSIVIAGRKLR